MIPPLILRAALAALLVMSTANAQEPTQVGQWSVGCEGDTALKTASCWIRTSVAVAGSQVAIAYYPFERRLLVGRKGHVLGVVARVDRGAPQSGQCTAEYCAFSDPGLIAALESGAQLTLLLSEPGQASLAVEHDLRDLQRAIGIAQRWRDAKIGGTNQTKPEATRRAAPPSAAMPQAALKPTPPKPGTREKKIAQYGDWSVICDDSEPQDTKKCHVDTSTVWENYRMLASYAATPPALFAFFNDHFAFAMTARIDGGPAVAAKCHFDLVYICWFADAAFYVGLQNGKSLTIEFNAAGKSSFQVAIVIADLHRGAAAVDAWLKLPPGKR